MMYLFAEGGGRGRLHMYAATVWPQWLVGLWPTCTKEPWREPCVVDLHHIAFRILSILFQCDAAALQHRPLDNGIL